MNIIVPSDDNLKWGKDRSQIRKFRATSPKKYTSQFQDSFHFQVRIISLRMKDYQTMVNGDQASSRATTSQTNYRHDNAFQN